MGGARGAGVDARGWSDLEGWVVLEVQDRLRAPGDLSFYVGSEVVAGGADALFLRAGYATDADQPGGASVGLGLRFERFEVSVAKSTAVSIMPVESDLLNVSFSLGL